MVSYFKFVYQQLCHMQSSSWKLWLFSLGAQLMIFLQASNPLNYVNIFTFLGSTLGVLCVTAINSAKPINGWLGLLSGICFIIVSFSAGNFLSIGEQVAYFITLDLPVICSAKWNKNMVSKIRHFGPKEWLISIAFTLAVWFIGSSIIGKFTIDPRPWIDGLSFSICLTGGIVCFLRYNNQYLWWLASGLIQVVLWFVTLKQGGVATPGMMVNSLIYVMNDFLAFTISPWYNKHSRENMIASERKMNSELY